MDDAEQEKFIHSVLRRLPRQRVARLVQPGDRWLIAHAVFTDPDVAEALLTCYMRGWIEPLKNAVPTDSPFGQVQPVYRLTDAGWNAIHGSQWWAVFASKIAVVSLLVSLASLVMSLISLSK